MLSDPSFKFALVFSINSSILSGFPLACFHLAEASYLLFHGFILLCVQLSKNITKFIIFHIFVTHFATRRFYILNLKT